MPDTPRDDQDEIHPGGYDADIAAEESDAGTADAGDAVEEASGTQPLTLAAKLNRLFELRPEDRGPYSNEEVAAAIAARGGPTISASYLWLLRTGRRTNPTLQHLEAIADHFGVTLDYFSEYPDQQDRVRRIYEEIPKVAALRNPDVMKLALRAHGLSPDTLSAIGHIIEQYRKTENLPEPDSSSHPLRRSSDFGADDAE